MGFFVVKENTECLVIKKNVEWLSSNFKNFTTTKTNVFDKAEMVIDPTGIAAWACTPRDFVTVGGAYAKAGYFGFFRDGFYLLVPGNKVEYA